MLNPEKLLGKIVGEVVSTNGSWGKKGKKKKNGGSTTPPTSAPTVQRSEPIRMPSRALPVQVSGERIV